MTFHDLQMTSITGEPVDFRQFAGRYNLIVNVASL
jgi:glutathione peroxidase-family protein